MLLPTIHMPVLSDWKANNFDVFNKCANRLASLTENVGKDGPDYKQRLAYLAELGHRGDINALKSSIKRSIDVLAVCDLLNNDAQFLSQVKIRRDVMECLLLGSKSFGLQILKSLVRLYFEKYTTLMAFPDFRDFCSLLKWQLQSFMQRNKQRQRKSAFLNLCRDAELFLKAAPFAALLPRIQSNFSGMDSFLSNYSLDLYHNGDFVQQCEIMYYIHVLEGIPVGENHAILQQVIKNKDRMVCDPKYGPRLGHAALRILIDRSPDSSVSQFWLDTIMEIAGDPRLPKSSIPYQNWWAVLGQQYTDKVIAWLSQNDLRLFLEVLQDLSKDNSDMMRMYPARKEFIESLLDKKLISQTRLIFSAEAVNYVRRKYGSKPPKWMQFATIQGGSAKNTSFIYINLCNKAYMMEGTHVCSLRIIPSISKRANFTNYLCRSFSDYDCRSGFSYYRANSSDKTFAVIHDIYGYWQDKATDFLVNCGLPLRKY